MLKIFTGYYSPLTIRIFLSASNHMRRHFLLLYVYKSTGSISSSAMVFLLEWLPKLISFGFFPRLSSFLGEKYLFAISTIISFLCIFSLPFFHLDFIHLFLMSFIFSLISSFSSIYIDTSSALRKGDDRYYKLQSLMQQAEQICTLIMPVISTYLVFGSTYSIDIGVYILFSLYLLCTLSAFFASLNTVYKNDEKKSAKKISDGIKYISNLPLRTYIIFSFISLITFSGISALLPDYLSSIHVKGEFSYSIIIFIASLFTILFLPIQNIITRRFGDKYSLIFLMVFYFISVIVILLPSDRFILLVVGYTLLSVSVNSLDVLFKIVRVQHIDMQDYRSAMGAFAIFMLLPIMCASIFLSLLGESFSITWLIIAISSPAILLLFYILHVIRVKKMEVIT